MSFTHYANWYREGVATLTSGSNTVTGTGTFWVDKVNPGDMLLVGPSVVSDVLEVVSDTELRLAVAYTGPDAVATPYAIVPTQGHVVQAGESLREFLLSLGDMWQAWMSGDLPRVINAKTFAFATREAAEASPPGLGRYDVIRTEGRWTPGDGGAATYLRTLSAVRGMFVDQSGNGWAPDFSNVPALEVFGARGNHPGHDDSAAIQDAFDAVHEFGRAKLRGTPGKTYYCGDASPLTMDCRSISLDGAGATFDFSPRSFGNPETTPQLAPDPNFANPGAWVYPSWQTVAPTFTGGRLVRTNTTDGYTTACIAVPLVQGRRYRLRIKVNSVGDGSGNPYVKWSMRTQPDAGGVFGNGTRFGFGTSGERYQDFFHSLPSGIYYFCTGSNNAFDIDSWSLREVPDNIGIWVRGDIATGVDGIYGQTTQALSNLRMDALGPTGTAYGDGILMQTPSEGFSSRMLFERMYVRGWNRSFAASDRSYLFKVDRSVITSFNTAGFEFMENSADAGENLQFTDVTFGNASGANAYDVIIGGGGYCHFSRCSLDYGKGYVLLRNGYAHFDQCHFERNMGDVASREFFTVDEGTLVLDKGYIQMNRSPATPVVPYMFHTYNAGRVLVRDTQAWGLTTSTGELWKDHASPTAADGLGRGHAHMRWSGIPQKSTSPFLTREPRWSHITPDPRGINEKSKGRITWDVYPDDGEPVSKHETSTGRVTLDTAAYRTAGIASVKLETLVNQGMGGRFRFNVPVPRDGMFGLEFWVRLTLPEGAVLGADQRTYIDCFELGAPERDPWGRRIAVQDIWANESTLYKFPPTMPAGWQRVQFAKVHTTNAKGLAQLREFGEPWRDCISVVINLDQLHAGAVIHITEAICTTI